MYTKKVIKIAAWAGAILGAIILVVAVTPFKIITAGERGVVLRLGAVNRTMSEGFNWKVPFIESVKVLDVRTQKEQVQASAASKDLQTVTAVVALNFHLDPESVSSLWKNIGSEFKSRIIDPAIQESVKAATAKYTAEELITKREQVKDEMRASLINRLAKEFIVVDEVSIVNFDFASEFNKTIEQKQVAVQQALKAENDLRRIKIEAEQRVAQAEAEAKAILLQSNAANNEKYVALKALEVQMEFAKHWDGKLPTQMVPGGALPFINVGK